MDSSVLWSAAARTRALADDTDAQLAGQEAAIAECGAGWAQRSRIEFDLFVSTLADRRVALSETLHRLDEGLRSAAHGYEHTDASTARTVADAGGGPALSL